MRELRHHFTRKGCENASTWDGGQRQHSSQMPCCNGADRVKVARVSRRKGSPTDVVGKADDGLRAGAPCGRRRPVCSVKVLRPNWKAACRETGLRGLERGKGRKALPIAI